MQNGLVVGIDLGTTNSAVSLKGIEVRTLYNAENEELTPSFVTALPKGDGDGFQVVTGKPSKDLMKQYPSHTISSVKRLMGREYEDLEVQNLILENRLSYALQTDASDPGAIKIRFGDCFKSPEEISSLILQKVVGDGSRDAGGKINSAVVTVPAYFTDRQKFATKAACRLAGLKLIRLLPEPTAAALSFGLNEDCEDVNTILVFDLGGGTFDISILHLSEGVFMEVAKGGDMWMGGDSIDHLITDFVFRETEKSESCESIPELLSLLPDVDRARFISELKEKCEAAKIQLSEQESAEIDLFGVLRDRDNNLVDIDVSLTREKFNSIISPMTRKLASLTERLLNEINFEVNLIDKVLMVGGSSLIPAIQDKLKGIFGDEKVYVHPRPMTAVAEGAALMAAKLAGTSQDKLELMHSASHNYYIQLAGGEKHLLVSRNTPLPVSVEQSLRFAQEHQRMARLRVFNEVDGIMESVGELWFFADPDKAKKRNSGKREELKLVFTVNENNLIDMAASSVEDPSRKVVAQIARDGATSKLYGDLERALSDIVATSETGSCVEDALDMGSGIASEILRVSDPETGNTFGSEKIRVQQKTANLVQLFKKVSAPIGRLRFADIALNVARPMLNNGKEERLKQITKELQQELDTLKAPDKAKQAIDELDVFWEEVPVVVRLAQLENISESMGSSVARELRQVIKECNEAYVEGGEDKLEDIQDRCDQLLGEFVRRDGPLRKFHRDVTL